MANSDLTPEQFTILFGDSDALSASNHHLALPSGSPRASLSDEEYMILFGDTMTLSLEQEDDGYENHGESEGDDLSVEQGTPAHSAPEIDESHAALAPEDEATWKAPLHVAPQHLAPQHSADTEIEDASGYVGTRFANSLQHAEESSEAEAEIIDLHAEPVSESDYPDSGQGRPKAPVPESVGLVDRMVSRVKQRLSDELGSTGN